MRNTLTSKFLTAAAVGALTLGAAACTSDGTDDPGDDPVEDIGNDIGDGVDDVGDELEEPVVDE